MLQSVRGGRTAMLGDGPAILAVQPRDHPSHQFAGTPKWFVATKSWRDAIQDRRELRAPPIRVYAVSRRLARRRGKQKAIVATGNSVLTVVYYLRDPAHLARLMRLATVWIPDVYVV